MSASNDFLCLLSIVAILVAGVQAFEPNPETEAGFKHLNTIMTGEIPIVLVNGMGKANPTVDEVAAEYNRTK